MPNDNFLLDLSLDFDQKKINKIIKAHKMFFWGSLIAMVLLALDLHLKITKFSTEENTPAYLIIAIPFLITLISSKIKVCLKIIFFEWRVFINTKTTDLPSGGYVSGISVPLS